MKKMFLWSIVVIITISLTATLSLAGCAAAEEPAAPAVDEPAPDPEPVVDEPAVDEPEEVAEEPAPEPDDEYPPLTGPAITEPEDAVTDDVIGAGDYTGDKSYEYFREQAVRGEFDENYAQDFKLAVTNFDAAIPNANEIVESVVEFWKLAGGRDDTILVLDNANDTSTMLANADQIFAWDADVYVQYASSVDTNATIARNAMEEDMFMLALATVVPGFPFFGVDNWGNGLSSGIIATTLINEQLGGIENVDRIYYALNPALGEHVSYRSWGARAHMIEELGPDADWLVEGSKAELVEFGADMQGVWMDVLNKYPADENIVVLTPYEPPAMGFYAAASALGRWDPDKCILISLGGSTGLGRPAIRSGILDAVVGWQMELYGGYVVPLALANMYGNPIPANTYLEDIFLTIDTIDDYYPGETTLFEE